jgi:hypothetical protein
MSNSIDTRWESARQDLANAADKAGIDPGVLAKIAGFESQYNPHARPIASHKHAGLNTVSQFDGVKAMSSAYGYGQFTNDTWTGMVHQYGEKYGVANAASLTDAQANSPELRNNTTLQAGMLAEFTRANITKGAQLGGPDPDANVYALHNLGGSAGATFLKTLREHPDTRIDAVLSAKVIERNPGLYGDGSGTVADAYKIMGQQMNKYAYYADDVRRMAPQHGQIARVQVLPAVVHTHATAPASGATAGLLNEGTHGNDVRALQDQLGKLGYAGLHGGPVRADGHYGPATKAAIEAFQRDHHLTPDGVAGPLTRRQLDNQSHLHAQETAKPELLNHPSHPDHAVFQQALDGVQKIDAKHGRASDQGTENLAAALAVAARTSGMSRIDHVVLSDDASHAWGVQGGLGSPFKQVASVNIGHAIGTPLEQSSRALSTSARSPEQASITVDEPQQSVGSMQR